MRRLFLLSSLLFACGPAPEQSQPFIHVTLTDPAGFTAPAANRLEFTTTSTVGGDVLTRTFEADIAGNALPTDFVVKFSEAVRGEAVDISVAGFLDDVNVYSATGSAIADVSELTLPVSFCGDNEIDASRQEACDDGAANADAVPNACRTSCLLPTCGDGVLDSDTEGCDDGNNIDADGCEADCSLPACGNGIFEPEDLNSSTTGGCFTSLPQTFNVPGISSQIIVSDINEDGNLDIISGFFEDTFLFFSLGNGDGTFETEQILSTPSGTMFISQANIKTTDSFPDIIASGDLDEPNLIISKSENINGSGFSVSNMVDVGAAGQAPNTQAAIASGDFDKDGDSDILISSDVLYFLDISNQTHTLQLPVLRNVSNEIVRFISATDIDLDTNQDAIFISETPTNKNLVILRGKGDRTFFTQILSPIDSNEFISGLAFADINQDGVEESAVCTTGKIVFVPTFSPDQTINVNTDLCSGLKSVDLDNDSKNDLIALEASNINWLFSSDGFETDHLFSGFNFNSISSVAVGDFNKDGFTDLVIGGVDSAGLNKIEVLLFDK